MEEKTYTRQEILGILAAAYQDQMEELTKGAKAWFLSMEEYEPARSMARRSATVIRGIHMAAGTFGITQQELEEYEPTEEDKQKTEAGLKDAAERSGKPEKKLKVEKIDISDDAAAHEAVESLLKALGLKDEEKTGSERQEAYAKETDMGDFTRMS